LGAEILEIKSLRVESLERRVLRQKLPLGIRLEGNAFQRLLKERTWRNIEIMENKGIGCD
jgi:hypothetical protein